MLLEGLYSQIPGYHCNGILHGQQDDKLHLFRARERDIIRTESQNHISID